MRKHTNSSVRNMTSLVKSLVDVNMDNKWLCCFHHSRLKKLATPASPTHI